MKDTAPRMYLDTRARDSVRTVPRHGNGFIWATTLEGADTTGLIAPRPVGVWKNQWTDVVPYFLPTGQGFIAYDAASGALSFVTLGALGGYKQERSIDFAPGWRQWAPLSTDSSGRPRVYAYHPELGQTLIATVGPSGLDWTTRCLISPPSATRALFMQGWVSGTYDVIGGIFYNDVTGKLVHTATRLDAGPPDRWSTSIELSWEPGWSIISDGYISGLFIVFYNPSNGRFRFASLTNGPNGFTELPWRDAEGSVGWRVIAPWNAGSGCGFLLQGSPGALLATANINTLDWASARIDKIPQDLDLFTTAWQPPGHSTLLGYSSAQGTLEVLRIVPDSPPRWEKWELPTRRHYSQLRAGVPFEGNPAPFVVFAANELFDPDLLRLEQSLQLMGGQLDRFYEALTGISGAISAFEKVISFPANLQKSLGEVNDDLRALLDITVVLKDFPGLVGRLFGAIHTALAGVQGFLQDEVLHALGIIVAEIKKIDAELEKVNQQVKKGSAEAAKLHHQIALADGLIVAYDLHENGKVPEQVAKAARDVDTALRKLGIEQLFKEVGDQFAPDCARLSGPIKNATALIQPIAAESNRVAAVIDRFANVQHILIEVGQSLKPFNWLVHAIASVIDFIEKYTIDPIFKLLGVDQLEQQIVQSIQNELDAAFRAIDLDGLLVCVRALAAQSFAGLAGPLDDIATRSAQVTAELVKLDKAVTR